MKKKIGKMVVIAIWIFIIGIILNKIFMMIVLQKAYDKYLEINEEENIYCKIDVDYTLKEFNDQINEIYICPEGRLSNNQYSVEGMTIATESYIDAKTGDFLRVSNVKTIDMETKEEYHNIDYEIYDYDLFAASERIMGSLAVDDVAYYNDLNILKKIYLMFCKNKLMTIDKIDDKWCFVIEKEDYAYIKDEEAEEYITPISIIKIGMKDFLPVTEKRSAGTLEEYIVKYECKLDTVTKEDVAWPDLSGKDIKIRNYNY